MLHVYMKGHSFKRCMFVSSISSRFYIRTSALFIVTGVDTEMQYWEMNDHKFAMLRTAVYLKRAVTEYAGTAPMAV